MSFQSRLTRTALATILATSLGVGASDAREMRVSSFEPGAGFFSQTLQAWIDEVNPKLSEGTSFKLYPGGILGAPPAQAELVAKGVADVALVVQTYSAGVFPMTSVVEVPGIAPDAATGTKVLATLFEDGALGKEYDDYKVIALFTTPGYRVFRSGEAANRPEDLKGLKMRTPSPFGSALLDLMGASGVPIPAPQVYENIERNVVGGAVWTMDAYRTFRLYEVAPYVTRTRLMASPLAILMNKRTYDGLSDADKAVIDEMSLAARGEWVAERIDTAEARIEAELLDQGEVTFVDLDAEAAEAWTTALGGAGALWLSDKPAEAGAVLDRAKAIAGE